MPEDTQSHPYRASAPSNVLSARTARINATREGYEAALKASGTTYQMHTYAGCGHDFHNNSTPRYAESAANLAWKRTMAWFHEHVG